MIYDCFSVFNELDLLEIRLNVLKDAGLSTQMIMANTI